MAAKTPHTICFRASDADREVIQAVADYTGLSLSGFVRSLVLDRCREIIEKEGAGAVVAAAQKAADARAKEKQSQDEANALLENLRAFS
ncbi:plasmid mobilization protein [Rhodococcus pyridinivorans]|uniref:plasmid mobilization protein n=1 Tax=Rhodococcus pyridinivorans TaxID=103816 RepID=UPI003AAE7D5F